MLMRGGRLLRNSVGLRGSYLQNREI